MKKLYIITGFVFLTLVACPQKREQTFHEIVKVEKGIMFPDGSVITSAKLTASPHTHLWSDIINNPANLTLKEAIEAMDYFPIPVKTSAEISKIIVPQGKAGLVFNSTDSTYQIYYNGSWKHFILDQ